MGSIHHARFQSEDNDPVSELQTQLADAEARAVEWMMRWGSAAEANRAMLDIAGEVVRDEPGCCGSHAFRVIAVGQDRQHGMAIESLRQQFRRELANEWAKQGRGMVDSAAVGKWLARRINAAN